MTALAACDLFSASGRSRSNALWQAEAAPYRPLLERFDDDIEWKAEDRLESIRKDFRAFKTSLKGHPAEVIKKSHWPYTVAVDRFSDSRQLNQLPADIDVFVFGMVLVKQSPGSAKGMVFVTVEDDKGFINLAFTPRIYSRYYRLVDQHPFLCVVGKLQRVNESHSVLVKRVFDYESGAELLPLKRKSAEEAEPAAIELIKPRAFH